MDAGRLGENADRLIRPALQDFLPDDAELHLGEAVAHATVNAEAEGQMLAGALTIDHQLVRVRDYVLVAVARDIPHGNLVALPDLLAAQLVILQGGTAHMGERRLPAYDFGNHVRDQRRVRLQLAVLLRELVERIETAGDRVTRCVVAADDEEDQVTIRERAGRLLDDMDTQQPVDWVDRISIELTTQMLATLFDFPFEERRKLTRWSDVATASEDSGVIESEEQRRAELLECADYFIGLWNERVNAREPGNDLISMLAHGESTRNMDKMEYLGNLILLIVGGNDTTRNSLSGGLYALNQFPEQYRKLQENPGVIPNMVAEIIRWQTPPAYMRRTALEDVELGGQKIRKGDKVAMWYVSGNRDDSVIENPNELIIDRERARQHLSFGFGIHRCVGNRLAEMQLRITWEEIMKRWPDQRIEVLQEPRRVYSSFVKGYEELMVVVPKRKN